MMFGRIIFYFLEDFEKFFFYVICKLFQVKVSRDFEKEIYVIDIDNKKQVYRVGV